MKRLLYSCMAVMLMLYSIQALAQDRTVTGRVTSTEDGSAIPGVSVLLKGTSVGTATDADGKYSLSVPAADGSLIFSFIGLESKEIAISERTVIDVSLALDVTQLSEVVVTALGVERESKSLGFSVEKVSNEELTVARTTNVVNALSAKVAGVRVAGSNGMTGSSSAIFIRGFTTFTGSNQPLFIIDGIPIDNSGGVNANQTGVSNSNRAIDINQDDIESMSILKGPAAAVLYGSRAAAGAIVITTKKGKPGAKNKIVEYAGSYNVTQPNRLPDYQNEYARGTSLNNGVPIAPIYQPGADQSNWGPIIAGQSVASPYSASDQALLGLPATETLTAYPNNVEDMFRDGWNAQHNLAFSGGNEKSNFYFSYNNLKDKGFLEGNFLERNSFRVNGNTQLSDKFTMGLTLNYINSQSERSQTGNQLSNPLFRGWFLPRDYDLKNSPWIKPDGSQIYFNGLSDHPFWTLRKNKYNDEINRMIGTVSLGYDFNDWLGIDYRIGTDFYSMRRDTYDAIGARGQVNHAVATGVGAVGERMTYNQETSSYLTVNLRKQLTDDIALTALIGNEINLQVGQDYGFVGNTLNTRDFRRITDATNFNPLVSSNTRKNLVGVFADVQGSYKGWLFVGLTGRNDWSSTFKKGNNSYFYPSVTSSVVLTEALPSLKNNILNFVKIKANWAKVGREAPVYSTDTYYFTTNPADGFGPQIVYPFQSQLGRSLGNTAGNAELGPEFTRSYEVGLSTGLFQDRIRMDLTYFNTRSTDIILSVPVAAASGFTNQFRNAGVLETNGVEITLGAAIIKTNDFQWNIDINWSRIRNNVISLADGVQSITIGGFTGAETRIEAGKPYGVIYANSLTRDAEGRILVNPTTGLPSIGSTILKGNPNPDWTGGITNTLAYKGITLSFLIDIRHGGDILSRVINDVRRTGTAAETAELPRFESDGVTPALNYIVPGVYADGSPNTIPVTSQQYFENMFSFASPGEGVFDASWVRLREASLFYALPKSLLEKTPFGKVEIGVNGRNLLLKTDVPHIDPETNLSGASNSQGLEFNTMPNARTYGAVIKFTF